MKKLLLILLLIASLSTFAQSWDTQASGFASASRGISKLEIIDANTVWGLAYDCYGAVSVSVHVVCVDM